MIEPKANVNRENLRSELLKMASTSEKTESIEHVFFDPSFPVDKRHNAKIHREELAERFANRVSK